MKKGRQQTNRTYAAVVATHFDSTGSRGYLRSSLATTLLKPRERSDLLLDTCLRRSQKTSHIETKRREKEECVQCWEPYHKGIQLRMAPLREATSRIQSLPLKMPPRRETGARAMHRPR